MESRIYFDDVLSHYNVNEQDAPLFALNLDLLLEYSIARGEGDSFRNEIRENWPKFLNEYQYDDIIIRYIEHKLLYVKLAYGKQFHLIKKDIFLMSLLTSVNVKLQIIHTNDNLLSTLKYLVISKTNLNYSPSFHYDIAKEVNWRINRYFGKDAVSIGKDVKEIVMLYKQELQLLYDFILDELEKRFESHAVPENITVREDEQIVNLKRQFETVIQNKNEEIATLKETLTSNKTSSQQDMIYAARQYDKAIEDIIIGLTENKFGNVLDKLYGYQTNSKQNEITDTLTNLFFILKTFGIETYQKELLQEKIEFKKEEIGKSYRIISGELEHHQGKATVIYPGWKIKNKVVVLPGIALL